MNVKMVTLIRRDLHMRRGKEIAMGQHASLAVILNEMQETSFLVNSIMSYKLPSKMLFMDDVLEQWINGSFTKICLIVNSEEELLSLHNKAKLAGLRTALIQDSGKTEFNGIPTYTTCAIGPNISEDIDKITGELKLY